MRFRGLSATGFTSRLRVIARLSRLSVRNWVIALNRRTNGPIANTHIPSAFRGTKRWPQMPSIMRSSSYSGLLSPCTANTTAGVPTAAGRSFQLTRKLKLTFQARPNDFHNTPLSRALALVSATKSTRLRGAGIVMKSFGSNGSASSR